MNLAWKNAYKMHNILAYVKKIIRLLFPCSIIIIIININNIIITISDYYPRQNKLRFPWNSFAKFSSHINYQAHFIDRPIKHNELILFVFIVETFTVLSHALSVFSWIITIFNRYHWLQSWGYSTLPFMCSHWFLP